MALPIDPTPLASQLLIALPSLAEPEFARTVALVCQHDEEGALGIVVNRPSEFTVGEVFSQMGLDSSDDALRAQVVLNGGPVHRERGFVIHDGGARWDSTLAVGDAMWLTTSRDILVAMARGEGPAHAVLALGCAGWGAGQLEHELTTDNAWLLAPADADLLFDMPLEARWQAAAHLIGVDLTRLADYSGRA